ncbi:NAD(P)-dependent oxidoreductase [Streptomyces durhamensis]|uniref:NAD(P)-dependent oxidoreductase n=1 Tax=Streptomyces durhamensis TaxID=68194 RepID=UPI00099D8B9D|nr:NAD(P)-dependent oxidoreductase [Streptomyces durhamensis]
MTTNQPPSPHDTPAPLGDRTAKTPVIAFLGTGRMGSPMAENLARSGFGLRVWNRTSSRAATLAEHGAFVARTPAEAVQGAGILITMLADGPATERAANGPDGFLPRCPGLVWVQMATVGARWSARLAVTAARHGVTFVDAPVSGSQAPARTGQLIILASGPDRVHDMLTPVFGALGRTTVWLGPAGDGTRAKLVLNTWLVDLVETTAEALSFTGRLGLDPASIVALLQSSPLGSPYAVQKATTMLAGDFTAAFALKHAVKDAELAVQAAYGIGTHLPLTEALLPRWRHTAVEHADDDLSAVYITA